MEYEEKLHTFIINELAKIADKIIKREEEDQKKDKKKGRKRSKY